MTSGELEIAASYAKLKAELENQFRKALTALQFEDISGARDDIIRGMELIDEHDRLLGITPTSQIRAETEAVLAQSTQEYLDRLKTVDVEF